MFMLVVFPAGPVAGQEAKGSPTGTAGFLDADNPGIWAEAGVTYQPPKEEPSVIGSSDEPVLVGIQPHSCTPVYSGGGTSGGGIGLDFAFADATGDCLTFSSLPDPPPIDRDEPRDYSAPQLAAIAADKARSLATLPAFEAAPAHIGLTGLPTYVWLARRPATVSATAEVPGLAVTAEAYPVRYLWDFGDGAGIETATHGRAWTRRQAGTIRHTYERKGRYTLAVRVVWYARWRVGTGPWQPLGHFMNAATRPHPVREVVSVLRRSPR
jgi:hypothetical protein